MSSFQIANELLRAGKLDEAVVAYRTAIEENPCFSWAYHNLAEALTQQRRFEEAIVAYRQATQLNPQSAWTYHNLAAILTQQGLWTEAIAVYQKATEINPEFSSKAFFADQNKLSQEQQQAKIIEYRDRIQKHPDQAEFYHVLGQLLQAVGQWTEAVTCFQRYIELQGDAVHLEFYRNLGEALLEETQFPEDRQQQINKVF
ncbi:tetratricopeptide repeat protein [Limnoraphis robusta Tam1]|uniref:tetratricopeptide repeat protein n=1 Tax=Limnoraphis robusta TaxID=1118279 RepID=UPI002B20BB9B|nr:tetratricopeptide repeat protein [Limnoraphis robusta]MEA5541442.1 tetratricopeptide repeat protein [Limnoraphis robusta Tam1]